MHQLATAPAEPLAKAAIQAPPRRLKLASALLMATWLGLSAGYVDLAAIVAKRFFINSDGWFRVARDFPWTVPLGHVLLSLVAALLVMGVVSIAPRLMTPGLSAWVLATLACWGALLRLPLWWWSSLILAVGVGWEFAHLVAARRFTLGRRWVRWSFVALAGGVVALFGATTGRQALAESREIARLAPARPGAPNVLLLVLDTVSASHMSLYGAERSTTPNLERWAKRGVTFQRAIAPGCWTVPSHTSLLAGEWPFATNSQWKKTLDTPGPTLAEVLKSRGYQTAGFVANIQNCGYETKLDRGFIRYEDYVLEPRSLLTRTVPGRWLLEHTWGLLDAHQRKWIRLESRPARDLNEGLLDWLGRRGSDRPFFAFMNYFDTHEPYIPAPEQTRRVGISPQNLGDFEFLFGFMEMDKRGLTPRTYALARDSYDDCLAYLDEQVGTLLDEMERGGLLENTVVVITSDHGESFGEHGSFCHAHSVFLEEVMVPLLIIAPETRNAGRSVYGEVSLRDLPASVMDLIGVPAADSPFPGRSLASLWRSRPGEAPEATTSPALAEHVYAGAFLPSPNQAEQRARATMTLVGMGGYQYIRTAEGSELLFLLPRDPAARFDLSREPEMRDILDNFRRALLEILVLNPGAPAVEAAYLETFRRGLANDLQRGGAPDS